MGTAREHGITKLYHYQGSRLDYLESTLRENWIYCPSPGGFNDPWDCRPNFDSAGIDDPEQRSKWIEFFKEQYSLLPQEVQANATEHFGATWYENDELLRRSIADTTKNVATNSAERFRIFCFSTSPSSTLMWAHYADDHRGFCLEFDATKEKIWRARRVNYVASFPIANADTIRDEDKLLETMLLTKSIDWQYEEEYRLLGRDGNLDPTYVLATENNNFLRLASGTITAVIAGSKADIGKVRQTIHQYAPGLPLKRAVPRPNDYQLEITVDQA